MVLLIVDVRLAIRIVKLWVLLCRGVPQCIRRHGSSKHRLQIWQARMVSHATRLGGYMVGHIVVLVVVERDSWGNHVDTANIADLSAMKAMLLSTTLDEDMLQGTVSN